jgi:hypothetical protein
MAHDDDKPASVKDVVAAGLKKTYLPPIVTTEALFTAAAGCGKGQPPTSFGCIHVPKSS